MFSVLSIRMWYPISITTSLGIPNQLLIYFRSLNYLLISQQPKIQPFDLISDVGGILCLFIGMSFVSFFEIIEIFIEIAFICYKNFNSSPQNLYQPNQPIQKSSILTDLIVRLNEFENEINQNDNISVKEWHFR